jgi:hypothetical protein
MGNALSGFADDKAQFPGDAGRARGVIETILPTAAN